MFEDISIDIDVRPFDQEYNMPPQYSFNGKTKCAGCNFDSSKNAAPKKWDKDEHVSLGQHTSQCGMRVRTAHRGCSETVSHHYGWHFACWLGFQLGGQMACFFIWGIHHFCLGRSLSEPSALQPGLAQQVTWPLSWPRWLEPQAGERGETNHLRHNHRFNLWCCLIASPQSFLLIVIFVQIAFGSSLDPKTHGTAVQPSPLYSLLCPALPFILSSKD